MRTADPRLLDAVRAVVPPEPALAPEYYYAGLDLCVLDSVFSLGIRYNTVRHVVRRYSEYYGVPRFRTHGTAAPPRGQQPSVAVLADRIGALGPHRFAEEVVGNRCRTSTRNGILKAEAAARFARTLADHGVTHFQDVAEGMADEGLRSALQAIPGQSSGLSVDYLWMLAGDDDGVKADRMVVRFATRALGAPVSAREAAEHVRAAAYALQDEVRALTPRMLDYLIWQTERSA